MALPPRGQGCATRVLNRLEPQLESLLQAIAANDSAIEQRQPNQEPRSLPRSLITTRWWPQRKSVLVIWLHTHLSNTSRQDWPSRPRSSGNT